MPKYAYYDPTLDPAPVRGWMDTDSLHYPNPPPPEHLLEMNEEQWRRRMEGHYAVSGGRLVPYELPPPKYTPAQQAMMAEMAGVEVTSASNPELNGKYRVDQQSQLRVSTTAMHAMRRGSFPGNVDSFPIVDTEGKTHNFTMDEFLEFADALADYGATLHLVITGSSDTLPEPKIELS